MPKWCYPPIGAVMLAKVRLGFAARAFPLRCTRLCAKRFFHGCAHGLKSYSIMTGAWSENFSPL